MIRDIEKPLQDFIADLNIVALSHFERHVKGTPLPSPPYINRKEKKTEPKATIAATIHSTVLPHPKKPSYAAVTEAPPPMLKYPLATKPKNIIVPKPPHKKAEEYRLVVRVSEGHPAQTMSPYAVLLDIKTFLTENLIREIQVIKTGFAICPISVSARDTLYSRMEEIEAYLSTRDECKVQKPTKHKAYLLSGIPRSYIGFNGSTPDQINITGDMIAEAIQSLTNIAPINVLEPRNFDGSEHLSQRCCKINSPASHAMRVSHRLVHCHAIVIISYVIFRFPT